MERFRVRDTSDAGPQSQAPERAFLRLRRLKEWRREKRETRQGTLSLFVILAFAPTSISAERERERGTQAGRLFCPKRGVERRDGEAGAEEEEQESKGERQERKKKREKGDHFVPTFQRKRSLK